MMKPYIAEVYELNGKTHTLAMPSKYHEILETAKVLGIKKKSDEVNLNTIGYKTLYIPEPIVGVDSPAEIIRVAKALAKFSDEQVRALGNMCRLFDLTFRDLAAILGKLFLDLEVSEYENQ